MERRGVGVRLNTTEHGFRTHFVREMSETGNRLHSAVFNVARTVATGLITTGTGIAVHEVNTRKRVREFVQWSFCE